MMAPRWRRCCAYVGTPHPVLIGSERHSVAADLFIWIQARKHGSMSQKLAPLSPLMVGLV